MTTDAVRIDSQPGPQRMFIESPADIVIYGGAAGGGKSYGLLLDPVLKGRINVPGFKSVTFRRTSPQITNPGALWDSSTGLYYMLQGVPNKQLLNWRWPSGASIKFAHMQYESSKEEWQGAQICMIGFDELTHFTETQFFYMLSRNRSTCGVKPYIRATTNPDAASWVAEFIAWWVDQDTGLPIPERAGVIRYMVRVQDAIYWGDSREEMIERFPDNTEDDIKSVTFIPAKVTDNKVLMEKDPAYLGNLKALGRVERERLLEGNWKVKAGGILFQDYWFNYVDDWPRSARLVRCWDFAGTVPTPENPDPDWTVGELWGFQAGLWYLVDVVRQRLSSGAVERLVKSTAEKDGRRVPVRIEQEPGSSGKGLVEHYIRNVLPGYNVKGVPATGDKVTRAQPVAAAAENGNIYLVRAPWNQAFINELVAFPDGAHDDQVDPASMAFEYLTSGSGVFDIDMGDQVDE